MSYIYIAQNKKIKIYSEVLDITKVDNIINILNVFYNKYQGEPDVVACIYNKMISFLDPYGYNKKFYNNRIKFINNFNKKISNCEYNNISLDKIIIELFSWNNQELKVFYSNSNSEKSVYNLGLRKKGGGMTNNYLLTYVKALSNKYNFEKTVYFFNNLDKLNEFNKYNNFLENYLNISEIYIDENIKYIDVEKLFLYLLQISNKKIIKLNKIFDFYYINFSIKNKSIKIYDNDKLINNIVWICISNKYDNDKYFNFYKIFDNIKIFIYINVLNNYIKKYFITAYNKKYDTLIVLDPYDNKFNYFSSKDNKINKILMNAKKDFEKNVQF